MSPTSQHFLATGAFDGFADYGGMAYIDVSSYSHVYPLTLKQAMASHWLWSKIECTASAELNVPPTHNLHASITDIPLGTMTGSNNGSGPSAPVKEPYERTCLPAYYIADNQYNVDGTSPSARIDVRIVPRIQRLYDGATDDPSNFIGWGLSGATTGGASGLNVRIAAATFGYGGGYARVEFGSYMHPWGTPLGGERIDDRKLTLNIDGEDVDFRMRQKLRLTGLAGSTDRTYTFTDSGCEAKAVFSQNTSVTFQHCKINITGIEVFTIS